MFAWMGVCVRVFMHMCECVCVGRRRGVCVSVSVHDSRLDCGGVKAVGQKNTGLSCMCSSITPLFIYTDGIHYPAGLRVYVCAGMPVCMEGRKRSSFRHASFYLSAVLFNVLRSVFNIPF